MSGGQIDCLLTLIGASKFVCFLDEPGQNVGAAERAVLGTVLQKNDAMNQVVLGITHHVCRNA